MLDGSLDQLRTFVAAAEEGNFSAAARRLRRAHSVVSQTLANLEGQIGCRREPLGLMGSKRSAPDIHGGKAAELSWVFTPPFETVPNDGRNRLTRR